MKKTALVCGASGFIGNHLVSRLKKEGYWVRGVDLKYPEFSKSEADHFVIRDLRDPRTVAEIVSYAGSNRNPFTTWASIFNKPFDEIYQLAADMGGAGYIFTGEHDANIMHNSATINLNILEEVRKLNEKLKLNKTKIFYSSSACIYPAYNQTDPNNPQCAEYSAYPAEPDSEYGWEKLFSERLYFAYSRNFNIPVRVARYHNIYGPLSCYMGGREKAPAAICRKVIENDKQIEIWGDGKQTRSFLYIDDCIDATRLFMDNEHFQGPVNIGSEEMVTIDQLVDTACQYENKTLERVYINGPQGVRGRNSDNKLIEKKLGWTPKWKLFDGLGSTYMWIQSEMKK